MGPSFHQLKTLSAWSETLKTGLLFKVQIISMIQFHLIPSNWQFVFFSLIINMSSDKVCLKLFELTYMSIVSLCCYNAFRFRYTSPACCSNSAKDFSAPPKFIQLWEAWAEKPLAAVVRQQAIMMKTKISCYAYRSQNLDEACILNGCSNLKDARLTVHLFENTTLWSTTKDQCFKYFAKKPIKNAHRSTQNSKIFSNPLMKGGIIGTQWLPPPDHF